MKLFANINKRKEREKNAHNISQQKNLEFQQLTC